MYIYFGLALGNSVGRFARRNASEGHVPGAILTSLCSELKNLLRSAKPFSMG